MRTTNVYTEEKLVEFINLTGERIPIGKILSNKYGGSPTTIETAGMFLESTSKTFKKREKGDDEVKLYPLGNGRSFDIINPADVQQDLFDEGWKLSFLSGGRGGSVISMLMYHPDYKYDDFIDYDKELWSGLDKLLLGIRLNFNLHLGHSSLNIFQGLFRIICTNGIIDQLMDMGKYTYSHDKQWDNNSLKRLEKAGLYELPDNKMGRYIGSSEATQIVCNMIREYYKAYNSNKKSIPDDLKVLAADSKYATLFSENAGNQMSNSFAIPFVTDLESVLKTKDKVYGADLVNSWTNIQNRKYPNKENPRGVHRIISTQGTVLESMASLVHLMDMGTKYGTSLSD